MPEEDDRVTCEDDGDETEGSNEETHDDDTSTYGESDSEQFGVSTSIISFLN